jgi:hypothetical protein
MRKASATVQFKGRMKEALRLKLERAAKQRGVSISAEIVHRLEQSFSADGVAGAVRDSYREMRDEALSALEQLRLGAERAAAAAAQKELTAMREAVTAAVKKAGGKK